MHDIIDYIADNASRFSADNQHRRNEARSKHIERHAASPCEAYRYNEAPIAINDAKYHNAYQRKRGYRKWSIDWPHRERALIDAV